MHQGLSIECRTSRRGRLTETAKPAHLCDLPLVRRNAIFIGGAVYTRPSFGTNHPLSYSRQGAVVELCDSLGWLGGKRRMDAPQAPLETLHRLHDVSYVAALKSASEQGRVDTATRAAYHFGTMENPLFPHVFERAATTVGGSILAAQLALEGKLAFHPAGGTHHGRPDRASGFCYFNDPAFAILTFLDAGLSRVLYVDIDAHHGDGVFDAFAHDNRVTCISIHEDKRWPHTGALAEQSAQALNVPVPWGINDVEYAAIMDRLVLPFVERLEPEAVVITCGADALAGDPLSKMGLSNHTLWQAVLQLCNAAPKAVVLGGGGYNPWTTVRCWAGLWGILSGQPFPDALPPRALQLLAGFESDLVEEDEVEPHWLNSLTDPVQAGTVRQEIEEILAQLAGVHELTERSPIH